MGAKSHTPGTPEAIQAIRESNARRKGQPFIYTAKPLPRQASGRGILRIASGTADLLDDPELISTWDEEELARGRKRDKNGGWAGRDPLVIPTNAYRELARRQIRKAEMTLAANLERAAQLLVDIINGDGSNADKIKAAALLMDRVMGKSLETVDVTVRTPVFIGILNGGIVPGPMLEIEPRDDDIVIDPEDDVIIEPDESLPINPIVEDIINAIPGEEDIEWE